MAMKLPKWLSREKTGAFVVDPDIAYPLILEKLGVKPEQYDQYWLEVALQSVKLAVQEIIRGSELDPGAGKALVIVIDTSKGQKERWAHVNHPAGKGVTAASKGLEAKNIHYPKVRRHLAAA